MAGTGARVKSGVENSDKYLQCREWIQYQIKDHKTAIKELTQMQEYIDDYEDQ